MGELRNKVIVITGASSGFGRGAALEFAKQGADLVLAARRDRVLRNLAKDCERRGVRALAVECDVSNRDDVEQLAQTALDEFGRIDIWINNAGVAAFGEFDRVPLEEHEQVIRTDLLGTMYGCYAAMRHFRDRGEGTLINMSSYLGKGSAPYHASYVAAKHGVRGLGMSLRQELEADGLDEAIHVCTVMPTSHDTPFFEHSANHTGKLVKPIKPFYDPRRVVDALVRLATDPEDEVMVGTSAKVASVMGKVAPDLLERRMASKVKSEHYGSDESAPDGPGAVFEPMRSGDDVYGGWMEREGSSKKWLTAAIGIPIAAGVAAIAWQAQRRAERKDPERAA